MPNAMSSLSARIGRFARSRSAMSDRAAGMRRPDGADQPETQIWRAVMFVDICGSTQLYETRGDTSGYAAIADGLERFATYVRGNGGEVVKQTGDGILTAFPGVAEAVQAALAMIRDHGNLVARPRIGLHYGPMLSTGEDIFGRTVNLADRIAGMADRDQILITAEALEELPKTSRLLFGFVSRTMLRGIRGRVSVYGYSGRFEETCEARRTTTLIGEPFFGLELVG